MARGNRRGGDLQRRWRSPDFLADVGRDLCAFWFLVHAWVLMGNHYYLVLSTPKGNLVVGMTWLQNT